MSHPLVITVGKLDAARRQLEVAVRLYFSEADPVSIHTLTAAAHQILADVNRARGGLAMLKEQIPDWVRPDASKEVKRHLNAAANFFKHAERDHSEVLEFVPSQTEIMLFDAVRKYRELAGEIVPILGVYDAWFWLGPGAELVKGPVIGPLVDALRRAFPGATRASFFTQVLPMLMTVETPRR